MQSQKKEYPFEIGKLWIDKPGGVCSRKNTSRLSQMEEKAGASKLPLFVRLLYLFFYPVQSALFQPGDLGLRYADFGGNLDLRHPLKKTQIEDFLFPSLRPRMASFRAISSSQFLSSL